MSDQIHSRTERRRAQQQNNKNQKPKNKKGLIKKIFLALVAIGFIGLISGLGLFAFYASSAPKLDEELLRDPLSSEILYANGELMYTTGVQKREYVNYEDIPKQMEDAILATEDVRFYKHHGMDFYRLGGAVLANFKRGFGSEGASTLSQQVIKNSFLTHDKTLKRKAQEAWLAFQLERNYEKEEIFEMYFNKILMSGNQYGFGTAADYFYGKKLDELELHEVAMLAGLPQSPNGHNPYKNPERAEKRRNVVLSLMHQHKKITKAEMEAAQAIDVTSTLLPEEHRVAKSNFKYPVLLDVVFNELEEAGLGDIVNDGVQIHTTFDPSAQHIVEEAINNPTIYIDDKIQSAITVLDTKTGGIVAVGGGRNYTTGLNFARQEKRQLGSTIKPILSYGPAIEYLNWSTGQVIKDEPYNYNDGKKTPVRNVDRKYMGPVTMREALYHSRNVPAVKTFEAVGRSEATNFAGKLGITLNDHNPSNALGGTRNEFSTIDLAGAYAAFGNNGVYTEPHSITKIVMRDGKTEKNLKPKSTVAMKESTAYMVTDMLRDVFTNGTGKHANISGLDIAGKTGTTDNAVDSWFAGYSTNYTIAAWGGYQDRTPMKQMQQQRYIPQDLFRTVMSGISANKQTPRFQKPSSVEEVEVVYLSDPLMKASPAVPASMKRTELFVKGSVPKEVVKEEVLLKAPFNLSASFDEGNNSITLAWEHESPDSELIEGDVEFIISANIDGGEQIEVARTNEFALAFSDVNRGSTYTFSVVASVGELKSDAISTTLKVDGEEEVIPEEEPEEEPETNPDEEKTPPQGDTNGETPDEGGNQGNNGNNDNSGNNGNNGSQGNTGNNNEGHREDEGSDTGTPPDDENDNEQP
ncbi:penicillin-binding protein 1A [Sporosarcina ureilytica]|uniref:Fibronectin type-III domain-containing protein n=1 Tax=Sporosarcina ureilytica TaxID=298596 RepID=A0A1D8JH48_9BACL|nr:penicillin-binding protein 1A [Sporosarcina ureilytica]AOV08040.1 hypothetical protein BI350_11165 [Sporosarcina ureilytica]